MQDDKDRKVLLHGVITNSYHGKEQVLFKNALLEALSETSIDGILVVNDHGQIVYFNKRFAEMWNLPPQVHYSKSENLINYVLVQLKEPDSFLERVNFLYSSKDAISRDVLDFKDGRVFDRYSSPLIDETGKRLGRIWYFRDITNQKQAEKELVKSQRRLAMAIEASGAGIYDHPVPLDDSTYHSERWAEILGYIKEELPPPERFMEWLSELIHPEDLPYLEKAYSEFIKIPGTDYNVEVRMKHRSGKWIYVHFRSKATERDENGHTKHAVGVMLDITRRKEVEKKLKLDEERLSALLELSQKETASEKELVSHALEECVTLTHSKVGYFHFFDEREKDIQLSTWSKATLEHCTAEKVPHYPLDSAGVWAESIRSRQPVIHNDYQNLVDRKGYPDGHIPVTRHLSVPVFDRNKIIAVVGVGNKDDPYDGSDVRQLKLFINSLLRIIKQKQAEKALQQERDILASANVELDLRRKAIEVAEKDWRDSFDALDDIMVIIDKDFTIRKINNRGLQLLGKDRNEIAGKKCYKVFHDKDKPESCPFHPFTYSKKVETIEYYEVKFNRYYSITRAPMLDENNEIVKFISLINDITLRKEMEEQLVSINKELTSRTEEVLAEKSLVETIIDSIPDGILYLDAGGKVVLINGPFRVLYKQTSGEDIFKGADVHGFQDNALSTVIKEVLSSGTDKQSMVELETDRHLQLFTSITRAPGKPPSGFLFVTTDVTPFIELDSMRKDFVSNVSHELRTPITSVNLSLQNVLDYGDRLREEQKNDLIERAAKSAVILSQMIEDLLFVSRIEAGKIKLHWKLYSPLEVLQDILGLMKPRLLEKQITVTVEVDPAIRLSGDPERIEQVFRVLIDNAIKYSDARTTITVTATNGHPGQSSSENNDGLMVHFRDQGRGIPAEDIPSLFTRFFRADNVKDLKGTGLGLNIARELVVLHGGDIQVMSELGKGSTFTVHLPGSAITTSDK
ncbi:MAG: PAS domain S-box protein [Candidatus Odinarchaeota archaeon]